MSKQIDPKLRVLLTKPRVTQLYTMEGKLKTQGIKK